MVQVADMHNVGLEAVEKLGETLVHVDVCESILASRKVYDVQPNALIVRVALVVLDVVR